MYSDVMIDAPERPPDPVYGRGACRRRVSIAVRNGRVDAHLSDNFHEMKCAVEHDGWLITAVSGEIVRYPTSACPSAVTQLESLVNLPIRTPTGRFYGDGRATLQCTHLLDLSVIAIRHVGRSGANATYEATVPDETSAPVEGTISRDGGLIHSWIIRAGRIEAPGALKGLPLGKGFAAWAQEAFDQEELDAATILARTWLVAAGRRPEFARAAGEPVRTDAKVAGRCYAFSMPRFASAVFTGQQEHDTPF